MYEKRIHVNFAKRNIHFDKLMKKYVEKKKKNKKKKKPNQTTQRKQRKQRNLTHNHKK